MARVSLHETRLAEHVDRVGAEHPPIDLATVDYAVRRPDVFNDRYGHVLDYMARVELEVGNSPKWKTWSKQRTQPHWTGLWSCEVLGPEGQQLGATAFQVGAP